MIAAVPVKDLVNAKRRLMRVLGSEERMELARTMLRDVLRALVEAKLDGVWVVTRDVEVRATARELGADVVLEADNQGHTAAVALAQARAAAQGVRVFLTVPGDVPCVTAAEIRALAAAVEHETAAAAFVPSASGLGTNGVALAPPDVMPLRFGEPSFQDHLAEARRRGLVSRVLALPGLGLDVDDEGDLRTLATHETSIASVRLLKDWALAARLSLAND